MRKCLMVCILGLVILTGCSRRYIVTLQNGHQMTSHGKPKLEGNVYVFDDGSGEQRRVSSSRIREISPASIASSPDSSGQ